MSSHPPHRVATVREALDLLRHMTRDLPEEGPFEDVVVEIHGDSALGSSPDPETMPDPLTWQAALVSFTTDTDVEITPGWERLRALDLRVVSEFGEVSTFLRGGGDLDELRDELAAPDMEAALYQAFRLLVERYVDRMESGHA